MEGSSWLIIGEQISVNLHAIYLFLKRLHSVNILKSKFLSMTYGELGMYFKENGSVSVE